MQHPLHAPCEFVKGNSALQVGVEKAERFIQAETWYIDQLFLCLLQLLLDVDDSFKHLFERCQLAQQFLFLALPVLAFALGIAH